MGENNEHGRLEWGGLDPGIVKNPTEKTASNLKLIPHVARERNIEVPGTDEALIDDTKHAGE